MQAQVKSDVQFGINSLRSEPGDVSKLKPLIQIVRKQTVIRADFSFDRELEEKGLTIDKYSLTLDLKEFGPNYL